MFRNRPSSALGAVIAICFSALVSLVPVSGATAAQDRISLNFAWPANLKAAVSYFYRQARDADGNSRSMTVYGTYDSRALTTPDGLRITTENSDIRVRSKGYPAGPQAKLQRYLAKAAAKQPAFVVKRSGEFVRLENLATYRNTLTDGLNAVFADVPSDARAKIAAAIAPHLSEEQLQAGIVTGWNRIVGAWVEAELDMGDLYELKFERPIPVLGNIPVRVVTEIRFVKRASCTAQDRERKCVELYMKTMLDDKSVAKAVQKKTARSLGASGAGISVIIKDYRTHETIRLLTEPRTLVPHRMHSVKKTVTTFQANGKTESAEQVEEIKVAYKYR